MKRSAASRSIDPNPKRPKLDDNNNLEDVENVQVGYNNNNNNINKVEREEGAVVIHTRPTSISPSPPFSVPFRCVNCGEYHCTSL